MRQQIDWALDLGGLVDSPGFHMMSAHAMCTLVHLLDQCRRQQRNPAIVVLGALDPAFSHLETFGWLKLSPESGGVMLTDKAVGLLVPRGRLTISPVAVGQTREDALAVACPDCGAQAGAACIGKRRGGAERAAPHAARYAAARGA